MTKEQAKQLNGAAAVLIAVGLIAGFLLSAIIGLILVLIAGGLFIYVFAQARKAGARQEMPGDPDPDAEDEDSDEDSAS